MMTRCRTRVLPALALLAGVAGAGCWPQHPKPERITGVWSVKHQWGIDSLVLAPGGSFVQVLQGRTGPLRASPARLGEERIEIMFEWGRTVLIFNPDIEGFTRQGPAPAANP